MFLVAAITLGLILLGLAAFVYGTIYLAKYAFRVSTGRGVAALLFPPYTIYFAFAELEEEEKALPAASWLFGVVVTVLLVGLFYAPLGHLLTGNFQALKPKSPGEVATEKYGSAEMSDDEGSGSEEMAEMIAGEESDESADESSESTGATAGSDDAGSAEADASGAGGSEEDAGSSGETSN